MGRHDLGRETRTDDGSVVDRRDFLECLGEKKVEVARGTQKRIVHQGGFTHTRTFVNVDDVVTNEKLKPVRFTVWHLEVVAYSRL